MSTSRIITDYALNEFNDYSKQTKVQYIVLPHILEIGEVEEDLFADTASPIFYFSVCFGNDVPINKVKYYFSTRTHAAIYRDNILNAIDKYWGNIYA